MSNVSQNNWFYREMLQCLNTHNSFLDWIALICYTVQIRTLYCKLQGVRILHGVFVAHSIKLSNASMCWECRW